MLLDWNERTPFVPCSQYVLKINPRDDRPRPPFVPIQYTFLSTNRPGSVSGIIILSAASRCQEYLSAPQLWSSPLPLFYFHIIAENTLLDDEGTSFEGDQEALRHARQMAVELSAGGSARRGVIVVENNDDGGLFEVPLGPWNS